VGTLGYRVLADAFVKEGVDTVFVLTGDGNMYWEAAFSESPDRHAIHVRHEHCACAMATAYARVTGRVGVASVTCGPGLTQTSTALATAAQAQIPLVVFAGESPMHAGWYNQQIDQGPIVTATGARYIAVHSRKRLQQAVTDAFHHARTRRQPVVLGVPFDLQQESIEDVPDYRPSSHYMPEVGPRLPHPEFLQRAVERVLGAKRIVILAGRGVKLAGAEAACVELAELCNAALATTLPMRGLFAGSGRDIGVAGGFAHPLTAEAITASDLVIAVGAGLNGYTTDGGKLVTAPQVLRIDDDPEDFVQGRKVADQVLAADAKLGVAALVRELRGKPGASWPDWGAADYASRVRTTPVDTREYAVPEGTIDPREVIRVLDRELPKDWNYVNGSGHSSFFSVHMFDRPAENFLTVREFGAIGNGLSYAVGMAAAHPDRPTVLIEGDGGLMMHAQELETVRRHGWKLLICVLNDGAFGSEIHKLRSDGISDHGATYGRSDLARMAEGFGLRGARVDRLDQLPALIAAFEAGDDAMVLDIQVSDQVISPRMLKGISRKK
jgi:thiamine pyrophosphate-dependent acetolactate synthase large subunit-like protein